MPDALDMLVAERLSATMRLVVAALALVAIGIGTYMVVIGVGVSHAGPDGQTVRVREPWWFALIGVFWSLVVLGGAASGRTAAVVLGVLGLALFSVTFLFSGGAFFVLPAVALILVLGTDLILARRRHREGSDGPA